MGNAIFDLVLNSLTVTLPNTVVINGTIALSSNGSAEDFSPYDAPFPPGDLTITLNAPPGTDIDDVIDNGGSASGSGSYSAVAANVIPEPESIAVWSVMGVVTGLVLAFRHRRRQASQDA
jgi:hypothetical protein